MMMKAVLFAIALLHVASAQDQQQQQQQNVPAPATTAQSSPMPIASPKPSDNTPPKPLTAVEIAAQKLRKMKEAFAQASGMLTYTSESVDATRERVAGIKDETKQEVDATLQDIDQAKETFQNTMTKM